MPEVRCSLFYSPQLDRLIGGDFFRDFQGREVKSSLMSLERANSLNAAIHELAEAYVTSFDGTEGEPSPIPVVLAIIAVGGFPIEVDGQQQVAAVQDLLTLRQLAGAPAEYRELAQLLTVVTDRATLRDRMPATAECSALVTQLFRVVGCGHRLPATFSRIGGCSLRPDSITPAGVLNDLYFLTKPGTAVLQSVELRLSQRNDLLNALATALEVANETSAPLEEMFARAVEAYTNCRGGDAVSQRAKDAAQKLSGLHHTSPSADDTIAGLADSMLENLSSS